MAAVSQALAMLDDPREQRFVELYVETNNATQSAIAAGYGVRGASVQGSRLLDRPKIKEAIAKRNAEFMTRYDFTPGRIVREWCKIAGANVEDFVALQDDGTFSIDFSTATKTQLAALQSIEEEVSEGRRRNKFKLHDKIKALTELGKIANLYPAQKLEHTGANGGPIVTANLHKIDIEALDHEQRAQLKQTLLMLTQKPNDNNSGSE